MGDHTFVCYAREDKDFVLKLCSNLESRGAHIWVDRKISIGANWENAVEQAIKDCASFLVVLSPAMVASAQARGELSMALDLQKPIVPIHYRACELPHRLRALQFLDCESASPDDEAVLGNILQALGVTSAVEPPASPTEPPWSAFLGQGAKSERRVYYRGPFHLGLGPNLRDDIRELLSRGKRGLHELVACPFCKKQVVRQGLIDHCDSKHVFASAVLPKEL